MYIAFEGIDYSGKTRLMNRVMLHLTSLDRDYTSVREPGGFSSLLRDYAIDNCTSEYERAVMMLADRILTHNKVIKPYLKRNEGKSPIILSDRCYLTSLVYQGAMSGYNELMDVVDMHDRLFEDDVLVQPDIIFLIRPDIDDVIERMTSSPKGGKLDATETLDREELVLRDEAYGSFATGGGYALLLDSTGPKIVEICATDLDEQLATVMRYLKS